MLMLYSTFILLLFYTSIVYSVEDTIEGYSSDFHYDVKLGSHPDTRFLLYSVNPGEGFNLRRDVYMRIANLARLLNQNTQQHWILVLPPWGGLYHWRDQRNSYKIRWSRFFDLESLEKLTPVMEFDDFLKHTSVVEKAYHLQEFKEGWRNGKWEERIEQRPCIKKTDFIKHGDHWQWLFWGYGDIASVISFSCLSVQLEYKNMVKYLGEHCRECRSILLNGAESLTHGSNSEWSIAWWRARRSMRFSNELIQQASEFRLKNLGSSDENDLTVVDKDWIQTKKKEGDAVGGPYLAVHLRRRDYLYAHPDVVPSIQEAARRIRRACKSMTLNKVYLATDAEQIDIDELTLLLKKDDIQVYSYKGKEKDGRRAIIDQIICSHARYFIGTSHSTFTFRIIEERQLFGFQSSSTHNSFCKTDGDTCDQPSKWAIQY